MQHEHIAYLPVTSPHFKTDFAMKHPDLNASVKWANTLSESQITALGVYQPNEEGYDPAYEEATDASNLAMAREILPEVKDENIVVFDFPRGGTFASNKLAEFFTQNQVPFRYVSVDKTTQKEVVRNNLDMPVSEEQLELLIPEGCSAYIVPESFVNEGSTLVGLVHRIVEARERRGETSPFKIYVITPTMRDVGMLRLIEVAGKLAEATDHNGEFVLMTHGVVMGVENGAIERFEHGDFNSNMLARRQRANA